MVNRNLIRSLEDDSLETELQGLFGGEAECGWPAALRSAGKLWPVPPSFGQLAIHGFLRQILENPSATFQFLFIFIDF